MRKGGILYLCLYLWKRCLCHDKMTFERLQIKSFSGGSRFAIADIIIFWVGCIGWWTIPSFKGHEYS